MVNPPPNSVDGCSQGVGVEMKTDTLKSVAVRSECEPSSDSLGRSWTFVVPPPRDLNFSLRSYVKLRGCGDGKIVSLTLNGRRKEEVIKQRHTRRTPHAEVVFGCLSIHTSHITGFSDRLHPEHLLDQNLQKCMIRHVIHAKPQKERSPTVP